MLTMTAAALAMFRSRRGRARSAWLALMAAVMFLPAAANAACGTLNLPDAHTSPTTSPMASGGTITVTLGALCDAFGLNPYPDTVGPNLSTLPQHGTVPVVNSRHGELDGKHKRLNSS